MLTSFLIAFFTILILLLMGGILAFYYFRSITTELRDEWETVLDNLNLRLDKIPNLLETVRNLVPNQEKIIAEIIRLRGESRATTEAGADKVQKELSISQKLRTLVDLGRKEPRLNKDINFLALKTELKQLDAEIEKTAAIYNERVRGYNKTSKLIFMRPIALIFRFPPKPVFEYEP